jgi:predicted ester cyclase
MNKFILALAFAGLALASNGQSLSKNKAVIQNLYEFFNKRNFTAFYSSFADSVLVHFSNNQSFYITPLQVKKGIDPQLKAFPGIMDTILHMMAEDDWVSICVKHAGVNADSLRGIPPSHKYIDYNVMEMYRLKNHRIIEIYVVEDFLSMYQQMELIPKRVSDLVNKKAN